MRKRVQAFIKANVQKNLQLDLMYNMKGIVYFIIIIIIQKWKIRKVCVELLMLCVIIFLYTIPK